MRGEDWASPAWRDWRRRQRATNAYRLSRRLRAWAERLGPEGLEREMRHNDSHFLAWLTPDDANAVRGMMGAKRQVGPVVSQVADEYPDPSRIYGIQRNYKLRHLWKLTTHWTAVGATVVVIMIFLEKLALWWLK